MHSHGVDHGDVLYAVLPSIIVDWLGLVLHTAWPCAALQPATQLLWGLLPATQPLTCRLRLLDSYRRCIRCRRSA